MQCIAIITVLFFSASFCSATPMSDTAIIKKHLLALTQTNQFRTYNNTSQLNETANFIQSIFARYSDSVSVQTFTADGKQYKNIIASFGTEHTKRIIIGAHYDVCDQQQGADDNASGVTGLLELARLLKGQPLNHRIDLVA